MDANASALVRTEGIPNRPGTAQHHGHRNSDAFRLALYATDDGSVCEWLWNSRDGVTPFCVWSRENPPRRMSHVHFEWDRFVPDYQPKPGERIFVTLTRELAREAAATVIERGWDAPECPASAMSPTKEEGIAALATRYFGNGDQPTLIDVPAPKATP
jgi:hypothetical protein